MHRGSKHSVRYHFVIMTASVWVWERAATMGVGAGLPAIKTLRFVSDSPVRPPQTSPLPEGSGQQRWAWELACQRLRRCGLSATARCAPADEPAPRGGRAATMGVGAGLPAIRRCGLSATARCAPRRRARSQRGSGQQGCARCGSWLASDSDAAVCQRQPGAPPADKPAPTEGYSSDNG